MNNEERILQMLEQLTEDVSGLKEDVSTLKGDVSGLKTEVSVLKEDVSDMRETLTRVAITQENVVLPQLRLLAEGHTHLSETLAPKERVDSLENDMAFMKVVVGSLSDRLAKLEKAQ